MKAHKNFAKKIVTINYMKLSINYITINSKTLL